MCSLAQSRQELQERTEDFATSAGSLCSRAGSASTMVFTNTPGAWALSAEQSLSFGFGLRELCSDTLGWQRRAGHLGRLCSQLPAAPAAAQAAADCREGC